jgi:hypothetical protein
MTIAPEIIVARDEDLQAVRQAVVDYCEGYYRRDPVQTERAYHSECLKRSFASTDDDVWYLTVQTPASMVDVSRVDHMRVDDPSYEIIIDDLSQNIASVRLYSDGWVDYLHVVKARGEWKLLHAAYTARSDQTDDPASAEDEEEITDRALDYIEAWFSRSASSVPMPRTVKGSSGHLPSEWSSSVHLARRSSRTVHGRSSSMTSLTMLPL